MKNTDKRATTNAVNVCSMPMPLKDVLRDICDDAIRASNNLRNDSHAKVLDAIYGYPVDSRLPDYIKNKITEIKANVLLMRKHDYTRDAMYYDLGDLAAICTVAIRREEQAETVRSVRAFFQYMVNHAEEVVIRLEANPAQKKMLEAFQEFLRMP